MIKFPFRSRVHIFSFVISSLCRLKKPYKYFLSISVSLLLLFRMFMSSMLFLVAVINIMIFFWMRLRGIMPKKLDSDIVVSEFEL